MKLLNHSHSTNGVRPSRSLDLPGPFFFRAEPGDHPRRIPKWENSMISRIARENMICYTTRNCLWNDSVTS